MKKWFTMGGLIAGIAVLALSHSCLGGGGGGGKCIASIIADGKTYKPEAGVDNAADALQFACNTYCLETDQVCEAMYWIWITSPKGKPGTTKMKAMYEEPRLLDCVTITCANRCVADVKAGKLQAKESCR